MTQFPPDVTALWAALRNECVLSDVMEMVRQDLEAEDVNQELIDDVEKLRLRIANRVTF